MSAEVFISFASQDYRVAMTLCSALESRGIACWISSRDIAPGENFQVAIVRAIRQAKVMLLVFTANSNNSDEMNKELALASQSKLIVVPLRIEDVRPNEAFAYEFATRQWIDFFADWELAVEQLAQRIQAATRGPILPPAEAPAPDAPASAALDGPAPAEPLSETVTAPVEARSFAAADKDDDDDAPAAQADETPTPRGPRRTALYVGVSLLAVAVVGLGLALRGVSSSKAGPAEGRVMIAVSPAATAAPPSVAAPPSAPADAVAIPPSDETPGAVKPVRRKKAAQTKPVEDVPF